MSAATAALTPEAELHWLALKMVPGLGARRCYLLLQQLGSPQAIFRATKSELEAAGLASSVAQSIASGCAFEDAAFQHQKLLSAGASLLTIQDPRYPPALAQIYDPPFALYTRGNLGLLDTVRLAIVGTRRPTAYGIAAAERLAADLATAGLTIVSGMAMGIDTAAQKAALSVGGATIAVFGCGADVVYPAENRKLAETIASKGLILSEFPLGAPAYPQNFPVRNRIIAGISEGVVVVEGAQYSGSAITAKLAMEQGREVFAVPGNITSKMSWGPNLLIKQGAKLVQEWNDIVVELSPEARRRLIAAGKRRLGADQGELELEPGGPPLSEQARAVFGRLSPDQPVHLDALVDNGNGISSSEIIAALFELEMSGLIKQLPGKNFVKVW